MGNCFGTPVTNSSTKSLSPEASRNSSKENNKLPAKSNSPRNEAENGNRQLGGTNRRVEEIQETYELPQITGRVITPSLKVFTYAELKSATRNFRPDTVLGEGGFGRVFKGWVDEKTYTPSRIGSGMAVAVKKIEPDSPQGLQEWQSEVNFLGKFSHPNLVKLLGYCWEDKEYLLVYEYMQKGSLENHLFRTGSVEPIPWDVRLKIAIGAARGLSFLHTSEKSVIYRDFKSSNILLDGGYNAKLSDFGLAKLGPISGHSHVTTRVMGTYGYAAPEYVATGHLYVRSDVYGFGVVLLEILTGLRALDTNRPSGEHNLLEWAKPSLSDNKKLKKIMDPRLGATYPPKAAFQAAQLIIRCLESDPKNRPSMEEVLESLEKINSIKVKAKVTNKPSDQKHGTGEKQQQRKHQHQHQNQNHHHHHHRSSFHEKHGVNNNTAGARSYHH